MFEFTQSNGQTPQIRDLLRTHGLRFNKFRSEWYRHAQNLDQLKGTLSAVPHEVELLHNP